VAGSTLDPGRKRCRSLCENESLGDLVGDGSREEAEKKKGYRLLALAGSTADSPGAQGGVTTPPVPFCIVPKHHGIIKGFLAVVCPGEPRTRRAVTSLAAAVSRQPPSMSRSVACGGWMPKERRLK